MTEANWLESRTCHQCGKNMFVLYPHLWRYKKTTGTNKTYYFCSYGCMRQNEKGEEDMNKITEGQKKKAIQIALEGGDPKPFLKQCGSAAPDKMWSYIKCCLRKKDPETWEKLSKGQTVKKQQVETPEGEFVFGTKTAEQEIPEQPKAEFTDFGKATRETRYTVTAIRYPEIGEFYFDKKFGEIDWRTPEGDEVGMSPTGWKILLRDLPEIFEALGVEV